MSLHSRTLQVGAKVKTDFAFGYVCSGPRIFSTHTIIARRDGLGSQSRVQFKVSPQVAKSSGGWMDADWFEEMK